MNIEVRRSGGFVEAMGHRVSETQGGEPEIRRRCLETLSRYDSPPTEVVFVSPGAEAPGRAGPAGRAASPGGAASQNAAETGAAAPAPDTQRSGKGPGVAKAKQRGR